MMIQTPTDGQQASRLFDWSTIVEFTSRTRAFRSIEWLWDRLGG
jgi:hypothetical protein